MDFKTLEDGRIVISTPNLSSPQKLSPGRLQDRTYCCCILRLHSWLRLTPLYKYLLPFSGNLLTQPVLRQWAKRKIKQTVLIFLFSVIFCCAIVIITFKDYARSILFWIEKQNSWLVFIVLLALFTIVSFPIVVGYLLLIITSGYLLGCFHGLVTVILGVNLGIFIAHNTIKSINRRCSISRYDVAQKKNRKHKPKLIQLELPHYILQLTYVTHCLLSALFDCLI